MCLSMNQSCNTFSGNGGSVKQWPQVMSWTTIEGVGNKDLLSKNLPAVFKIGRYSFGQRTMALDMYVRG